MDNMLLPDFLIIGTQRGGTTWLHMSLWEHPDIGMAQGDRIKEINYFDSDENWNKGVEWYKAHFDKFENVKAVGESTTEYMYDINAPRRMSEVLPGARLIMILRDPIDRAYSAYWLFRDRFQGINFLDAAEMDNKEMLRRGLYAEQIKRLKEYYSADQMLILFYDDLKKDNRKYVKRVFEFIGVDSNYEPSVLNASYNAVIYPHLQDRLNRYGLKWIVDCVKKTGVGALIRKINRFKKGGSYPEMDIDERKALQEFYKKPDEELEELLGVKIPWR